MVYTTFKVLAPLSSFLFLFPLSFPFPFSFDKYSEAILQTALFLRNYRPIFKSVGAFFEFCFHLFQKLRFF